MMTKKKKEQEDTMHVDANKTTDFKENNNSASDSSKGSETGAEASEPASAEPVTKTEEEASADKTIAEVRALEEKLAEMQDKYIRLSAEFDNYRKRTLREKMDLSKYAGEEFLKKFIPIMDDFERALMHLETAAECKPVKDGIDLIYSKLLDFLRQSGVKEIEALSGVFDVDVHEAVAKIPVEEESKKGKVVDVIQKGYFLHDKILRFSKVVVGE